MTDRPKALRFAEALADAEQRIVDAIPSLIDGLIARAEQGDTRAALYLLDRDMGKAAAAKAAPADDREPPYTERDFLVGLAAREAEPPRPKIIPGRDERPVKAAPSGATKQLDVVRFGFSPGALDRNR